MKITEHTYTLKMLGSCPIFNNIGPIEDTKSTVLTQVATFIRLSKALLYTCCDEKQKHFLQGTQKPLEGVEISDADDD